MNLETVTFFLFADFPGFGLGAGVVNVLGLQWIMCSGRLGPGTRLPHWWHTDNLSWTAGVPSEKYRYKILFLESIIYRLINVMLEIF